MDTSNGQHVQKKGTSGPITEDDEPVWTTAQYQQWATGGDPGGPAEPRPHSRRAPARQSATIATLFPLLECFRGVSGAIGLYWLVPMMFGLVFPSSSTVIHVRQAPVACATTATTAALVAVCPGLPAGCELRFRHWPAGTWFRYEPLVRFVHQTHCHVLAGRFHTADRRFGRRFDHHFPMEPQMDDLYVLTVGGVPLATMGVHRGDTSEPDYISALCAVTNSRGGSLMVRHLQASGRSLELEATSASIEFWTKHHGFRPMVSGSLLLQWP